MLCMPSAQVKLLPMLFQESELQECIRSGCVYYKFCTHGGSPCNDHRRTGWMEELHCGCSRRLRWADHWAMLCGPSLDGLHGLQTQGHLYGLQAGAQATYQLMGWRRSACSWSAAFMPKYCSSRSLKKMAGTMRAHLHSAMGAGQCVDCPFTR